MPSARIAAVSSSRCRFYSTASSPRAIQSLPNASVQTFRRQAFEPAIPMLFPRSQFSNLPAILKWFCASGAAGEHSLNTSYLSRFNSTTVPVEITDDSRFARIEHSLDFFLNAAATAAPAPRVYLAQASLANLPIALRYDVPTPDVVLHVGSGDVYDSAIWLGPAPTYTPLHRDPNPNLLVQLAGTKVVRLFRPSVGHAVFSIVQEMVQGSASATMRGEEMMQGAEKQALEREVWDKDSAHLGDCWEATLSSGDGLFIPKGWWHSVKGVGKGITGSVNWWFR